MAVTQLPNPFAGPSPVDVDVLTTTRQALHQVAEQVLASARFAATGRIGLAPTLRGLATPPFPGPDGSDLVVAVDGADLVVATGGVEQRSPLTTVRAAADVLGVEPGAPPVYEPATRSDPDRPLDLDPDSVRMLGRWWSFGAAALEAATTLASELGDGRTSGPVVLWPEHFDLAATWKGADPASEEALNLGVSPGDADHPEPYAYVGPWPPPEPGSDPWWNAPFGHLAPAGAFSCVEDLAELFVEGLRRTRPAA